jgi:hypothetical protein
MHVKEIGPAGKIRNFGSYSSRELRALKFASVRQVNLAIDLIWKDPILKRFPFNTPDGITLFVPKEAVPFFKEAKLKFRVSELLHDDELPLSELREMRRKHGM